MSSTQKKRQAEKQATSGRRRKPDISSSTVEIDGGEEERASHRPGILASQTAIPIAHSITSFSRSGEVRTKNVTTMISKHPQADSSRPSLIRAPDRNTAVEGSDYVPSLDDVMEPVEYDPQYTSFKSAYDAEFNPSSKPRIRPVEVYNYLTYSSKALVLNIFSKDGPMHCWVRHDREDFLAEFIRLEGRGAFIDSLVCHSCYAEGADPEYRCIDCVASGKLLCKICMVQAHQHLPCHRIEVRTSKMT